MLTRHLDLLHDLFRIYPKTEQTFRGNIRAANLEKGIKGTEFQFKKERILIFYYLLEKTDGLSRAQIRTLADAVLFKHRDKQAVLELLKVARKEDEGYIKGFVKSITRSSKPSKEEVMWRDANKFASTVSDSRFLLQLSMAPVDEYLHDVTADTEETAYVFLRKLIVSLVDGIGQQIFSIQKAECDKQIERETNTEQDKELGILRSELVHQVEDLSRERSRSYVYSNSVNGLYHNTAQS
jgi:hypothetical protein